MGKSTSSDEDITQKIRYERTLISVISCPSKRPQYLSRTLEQIDKEGGAPYKRVLYLDGPLGREDQLIPIGWQVQGILNGPSGARLAMWYVLRHFARYQVDCDRLLYMEDDLLLTEDAITKALSNEIPNDVAYVSFYDGKEYPPDTPYGLHRTPAMGHDGRGKYGTLCMLIPRRTVEWVVSKGAFEWGNRETIYAGDVTFSAAVSQGPTPDYLVHVPSLVDHAGDVSTQRDKPIRRASHVWKPPGRFIYMLTATEYRHWQRKQGYQATVRLRLDYQGEGTYEIRAPNGETLLAWQRKRGEKPVVKKNRNTKPG